MTSRTYSIKPRPIQLNLELNLDPSHMNMDSENAIETIINVDEELTDL